MHTVSSDPSLIVLANRAPFTHHRDPDGLLRRVRTASGLVTAIEPLAEALSGTWVAHGGDADCEAGDARGRVRVRSRGNGYHVRYVPIPADDYQRYYGGFANEGLWPLCHAAGVSAVFRPDDYRAYRAANQQFAAAVAEEAAGGAPYVLVQDYHFALAPQLIRQRLSSSPIVAFWHIPWPEPRVLATCPWAVELLHGLLGSDVIGLQTDADCERFIDCAARAGCDVSFSGRTVRHAGHTTVVRAFPVGVQVQACELAGVPPPATCRADVFQQHGLSPDTQLCVGVDRLDYSKGIPRKLLAVEQLLESRPDLHGRFTLLQVAEPSRTSLPAYRQLREVVAAHADRIARRFGTPAWQPILLLEQHVEAAAIYRLYRAADVCVVNSLRDGMNLVAKEFVASRDDEQGVLILSEQAGASQQLRAAMLVNPFGVAQLARTLADALAMSRGEQRRRMRAMRAVVAASDCYWWADQLLGAVAAPAAQPRYWPSADTSLRLTTF